MPPYLSYVSALPVSELEQRHARRVTVRASLLFVAGFSVVAAARQARAGRRRPDDGDEVRQPPAAGRFRCPWYGLTVEGNHWPAPLMAMCRLRPSTQVRIRRGDGPRGMLGR